jgi:hypothetical protein
MADQFACRNCGKKVEIEKEGADAPDCCDQPMEKEEMPFCTVSTTAEHSRMDDLGEPCDDGRSGKV